MEDVRYSNEELEDMTGKLIDSILFPEQDLLPVLEFLWERRMSQIRQGDSVGLLNLFKTLVLLKGRDALPDYRHLLENMSYGLKKLVLSILNLDIDEELQTLRQSGIREERLVHVQRQLEQYYSILVSALAHDREIFITLVRNPSLDFLVEKSTALR